MISTLSLLLAIVVTMAAAMKLASDRYEARSAPLLAGAVFTVLWFLGLYLCIPPVAIFIFHDWRSYPVFAVYQIWALVLSVVFGGAFAYALWARSRRS